MTARKKRTVNGAVIAPTVPTTIEAKKKTRSIEATESAQNLRRSPSTAPADGTYPTQTLSPTATYQNTTTHPNHPENDVPTTKKTTTTAASGNAPGATTKSTHPKKKNPLTAPPDPTSVKSKNRDPTTTGHPGPQLWTTETKKSRNLHLLLLFLSTQQNPKSRNPRPRDRKSISMPEIVKRGTRRGWLGKSRGRRGRWWGR